jgi:hypothetical protein
LTASARISSAQNAQRLVVTSGMGVLELEPELVSGQQRDGSVGDTEQQR